MKESLAKLVETTPKEKLVKTKILAKKLGGPFDLLIKKGVYPYEYMNSFKRFGERQLPPKESFYSVLSGKGIDEKDWEHGQKVWKTFNCQNLGDYHERLRGNGRCAVGRRFRKFQAALYAKLQT